MPYPKKIISGGQSGVDRAALDVALELGLERGGWCPKGRAAEDGRIDAKYPLRETGSEDPNVRTERNARDSDATLILARGEPTGGTAYTIAMAEKHGKPYLVLDLQKRKRIKGAVNWLIANQMRVLNVAGPRESKSPGIYLEARAFLEKLIAAVRAYQDRPTQMIF